MAANAAEQEPGEAYAWVRCACGNSLWKRFPDRLEMHFRPRGGKGQQGNVRRERAISVSPEAAWVVAVTCEKCGLVSVGA